MERNKLTFINRDNPEFTFMFQSFVDPVMENKEYGEVLQYVGTVLAPNGLVHHEFRHRCNPLTNQRQYWHIPASKRFQYEVTTGIFQGKWY